MSVLDGITDGLALIRNLHEKGNKIPIIAASSDFGLPEIAAFFRNELCKGITKMPKPFDLADPPRLVQKVYEEAQRSSGIHHDFNMGHDPSVYFSFINSVTVIIALISTNV